MCVNTRAHAHTHTHTHTHATKKIMVCHNWSMSKLAKLYVAYLFVSSIVYQSLQWESELQVKKTCSLCEGKSHLLVYHCICQEGFEQTHSLVKQLLGQWFLTWVRSNHRVSAEVNNYKAIFNNTIFDIHVWLVLFNEHGDFVCN